MKIKQTLILFLFLVIAGISGIGVFNYAVNPLCYFRCENITLERQTVNSYYQNAQRVLQFPDTELIVIGSSRGESTPLQWLSEKTHLKALNLSVGGAEIHAQTAFLEFARARLKLKKVVWIADYFSLIDETASDKIRFTPALRRFDTDVKSATLPEKLKSVSLLLDHNTLEASFAMLKRKRHGTAAPDRGAATDVDVDRCDRELKKSKLTPDMLQKEIGKLFDGYAHKILQPEQSERAYENLNRIATVLKGDGTELVLLIPGYHPAFWSRLKTEFPIIADRHENWIRRLESLRGRGVKVLNFFHGMPGDDGSPGFWADGVHFTCHAAIQMLHNNL